MKSHPAEPQQLTADGLSVSLTYCPLDTSSILASVKSPKAGAVVLFAGFLSLLPESLLHADKSEKELPGIISMGSPSSSCNTRRIHRER